MKHPKISIVTPSFNQAQFLEATIQSILSQSYPNLEYIIIDGGSTDGSVEIIQKYAEHLHFWCSEPDAGQYDAINKGFVHSTGEIMAWLNSDDMYYPWTLKTIASIMTELPQVEWLTTLSPSFWDWHGFSKGFAHIPGYSREAFLDGRYLRWNRRAINWIQQESTCWRRSLWEKSGGSLSTQFKLASDFDLWARFYAHADLFGTESPIGGFRWQSNQQSRHIEQYAAEAEQSLKRLQSQLNWKPNHLRELAYQCGFDRLPKIRTLSKPLYSYTGKRVVRENFDSSDACWQVEEHCFGLLA